MLLQVLALVNAPLLKYMSKTAAACCWLHFMSIHAAALRCRRWEYCATAD
jgi:hypothetical protein